MGLPAFTSWPTNSVVPFQLELADASGSGSSGKTPQVSIRRFKETHTDVLLDNWFWNGSAFQSTPFFFNMVEVDGTNSPGLYQYQFRQDSIGIEQIYHVYFQHLVTPVGFSVETHVITNEVFSPQVLPDPIVVGPASIMGQLELIKDGGLGDFDPAIHTLSKLGFGLERVLGLLHHNAIVDNQTYDTNQQITSARLRVFDSAANVPAAPGGSETTGLLQEYAVTMEYIGVGVLSNYQLKQVL